METKIVRNDTGLDFSRIEKIIALLHRKIDDKIHGLDKEKKLIQKQKKETMYKDLGVEEHVKVINEIDEQIKLLQSQKREHEDQVRDITQGQKNRYGSYDDIREGSAAYEYIHVNDDSYNQKAQELRDMRQQLEESLWLAKDINEAVNLYSAFCEKVGGNRGDG